MPNHHTGIDPFVLMSWCEKFGILGSLNGFAKKLLLWIPIFGQNLLFGKTIFLDRSFEKDQIQMKSKLREFIDLKFPSSTVFYPEGTRFTREKYETSKKFAISRGLPVFKHHLTPRTKGFKICVEVMKQIDKTCAILNHHYEFEGAEPTFMNLLKGKRMKIHIFMESIPLEKVEATDEWLYDLFKTKDELRDSFIKHGNFHQGRNVQPYEVREMKPNLSVLINFLVWFLLMIITCVSFAILMIKNGFIITFIIVVLSCE